MFEASRWPFSSRVNDPPNSKYLSDTHFEQEYRKNQVAAQCLLLPLYTHDHLFGQDPVKEQQGLGDYIFQAQD